MIKKAQPPKVAIYNIPVGDSLHRTLKYWYEMRWRCNFNTWASMIPSKRKRYLKGREAVSDHIQWHLTQYFGGNWTRYRTSQNKDGSFELRIGLDNLDIKHEVSDNSCKSEEHY